MSWINYFKIIREGTFRETGINIFMWEVYKEVRKLLYNFCWYVTLLGYFLYVESFCFFWNIIFSNTCERENSFIFDTLYNFTNNRNTRMILVFLNSLFNWIRNVRNIAEVLLVDFDSKIWYSIKNESVKNICYFVIISNKQIIFVKYYIVMWS